MRLTNNILINAVLISCCATANVYAANSFIVQNIQIQGLQQFSQRTVLSYIPIKTGEALDDTKSAATLQSLYNTGFFENVSLTRVGNTLVVRVVERGTIGAVTITGNKKIKTADIKTLLKNANLVNGGILNQANLESFQAQLQQQYINMGRYNAHVNVATAAMSGNRLAVTVAINEGNVAQVHAIRIVGNTAFSEKKLLRQFILTTPHIWSFISHNDQYTKDKLDASIQALETFYLNHGFLRYRTISTDVNLSPDRSGVTIIVTISEGPLYHFSGFQIGGNLILPRDQLAMLVRFHPGDVFSRKAIIDSDEAMGLALGNIGYAFAQVEPVPTINEQTREVFVNFFINPGQKVYVRRILVSGNTMTADYVVRAAIQQLEGSIVSLQSIRSSIRQLNLTGFFKTVDVKTIPVPGTTNQVDLNYIVEETPAGQATLSLGYGSGGIGFDVSAGINQPNFLGTGRTVGVNFTKSLYSTSYSFSYFNPFYTVNGIGHGFTLSYQKASPSSVNLSNYSFSTYGASGYYTIPLSLYDQLQVGAGVNHIEVSLGAGLTSIELATFVANHGSVFNQMVLTGGWSHNGLDAAIYPTKGFASSLSGTLSVPVSSPTLEYYQISYGAQYYLPLNRIHSFIFLLSGGLGYGNGYGSQGALPFFENFYAGGLAAGQVLGYGTNTLGPRDSLGNTIGGNFLVYGSAAIIFPNHLSESIRTSIFLDAGNVYQTKNGLDTFGAGPIRYSAGIGVEWRSPIGPLTFSLAKALNKQSSDRTEPFQFTMGTSF